VPMEQVLMKNISQSQILGLHNQLSLFDL
jgi:hypothetical protein